MRGFLSSSGKPIKHHTLVAKLLEAIFLKAQLAIVKCAAHSFGTDPVTRGNNAATEAAFSSFSMVCLVTSLQLTDQISLPSINDVADMQCCIYAAEIDVWMRKTKLQPSCLSLFTLPCLVLCNTRYHACRKRRHK